MLLFNGILHNFLHVYVKGLAIVLSYSILAILGVIFLSGGFFMLATDPYNFFFNQRILFVPGGEIFELWRAPPVDLYLRVWVFNITNHEEFLAGNEKMKVVEVGPYVYRELMTHENVTFNENGTVSANPRHILEFVPEQSVSDHETDRLILPNIALLSIADVVSTGSYLTKLGLNLLIRQTKTQPLVEMSPKEFMFGYSSTLMTLGNKLLPHWINFEKLGLIDRMYNFEGDYETVYTGANDINAAGLIETYNGAPQMPQWEGRCGNIANSSDGTKFRSNIQPNETQKFFRKSVCRPQTLMMTNHTIQSGLEAFVYKFPANAMDNGIVDSENACFCRTKQCLRRGLLDVRQCYYGFPIALSYPHFLDSDDSLRNEVEGYTPDRRAHETYFVVQPKSGLPLEVAVRFQINMSLGKIGNVANVRQFEDMVIPLLWTEIRMYHLPDDLVWKFFTYLNILPHLVASITYALIIGGILGLTVWTCKYCKRTRPSQGVSWLDGDDYETPRMDKKFADYRPTKRSSMSPKELEVYYNSLVAPNDQDLEPNEYNEMIV
ncbi:scavenger receptor class B member 1-like isoform X3 [Atheta coriaria]|uniref:scavenger receptor class B member 1-like isoform X3 n=1 Tax=Dalotia coriaria TaxID=877792 RepID=UPI0031F41689